MLSSGGPLEGALGSLLVRLGASWAVLEPSWAVLGPSWGPLGPSWGDLGGLFCRLRRCLDQRSEYAKNVRFTKGMGRFLPLAGPLGGLLGRLGGLLGHLGAILWVSWAVLERREAEKARTPKSLKKLRDID